MSADIELLPLPGHFAHQHDNVKKLVREYALANMAELADDRDDLLARLDASIDHGTKLGEAKQRCLDEVLELKAEIERLRGEVELQRELSAQHAREAVFWERKHVDSVSRAERLARGVTEALAQQPEAVDGAIGAKLCMLAAEIYSEWDEGNDPRVGKMLRALAEPKFAAAYRADIAELHAALAAQQGGSDND